MNCSSVSNITSHSAPAASQPLPVAAMTTAYSIIFFVALFGNLLVIYIVATRSYMKTTFNFLIVNMAIADLLVSVFIIPLQVKFLYIGQLWLGGGFGTVTCKWINFSGMLSIGASILALVAISLDRYFAIIHPFKHLPVIRNTKLITSIIWIVSALFMFPYILLYDVDKYTGKNEWHCRMIWTIISSSVKTQFEFARSFFMTTLIALYVFPLFIIATLYITIGRKLSSRKIPGNSTPNIQRKAQSSKRKVLRMLIIVVVVFALCWLPAHLVHLVKLYATKWLFSKVLNKAPFLENITFFICHANSAINPLLYVMLNSKFKREFFVVLRYWFPNMKPREEHFLLTTVASEA